MADVVKREDPNKFAVHLRANTPDFPPADWIRNPLNLAALIGSGTAEAPQVPKRYWVVDPPQSNNLREMTGPEKAAVDGAPSPAELTAARAARKAVLTAVAEQFLAGRYDPDRQRSFLQLRQGATGQQLAALNSWLDWVRSVFEALNGRLNAVDAATTLPAVEAVSFDTSSFVVTDPGMTLQQAATATNPVARSSRG